MKKVFSLLLMMFLLFICSACAVEITPDLIENNPSEESDNISHKPKVDVPLDGPYLNPNRFIKYKDAYNRAKDIIENGEEADWSEAEIEVFRRYIQFYEVFECELDDDFDNDLFGVDSEEYKNFINSYHEIQFIFLEDEGIVDYYEWFEINN